MGLETATYINGLVSTNPTSTDPKSQGDDHLRLLKSTILATFPNITGAVSATHTQLNYLASATGTTGTTSSNVVFSASPTFTGTVNAAALTLSGVLTGTTAAFTRATNGDVITFISGAASGKTGYLYADATGAGLFFAAAGTGAGHAVTTNEAILYSPDQGTVVKVNNTTVNVTGLPTGSGGLASGDLWNDSGTLKIV